VYWIKWQPTVTASEELSEIYLSILADCSDAGASSVGRSQEDRAQWSAVNDRRYFTATMTSNRHKRCSARHPLTKSPAIYLSTLFSSVYTPGHWSCSSCSLYG